MEELKPQPATAHQPSRQSVESPSPNTLPPLASLVALNQFPLPLVSPLSVEHQEDKSDLKRIPQSSIPVPSYLTSLGNTISGLDRCNHPISLLSWWWAAAKALYFPAWAHSKCNQERRSHQPAERSWSNTIPWQIEAGVLSIKPNVQKLLETLIRKRVELKLWEEKEKKRVVYQTNEPRLPPALSRQDIEVTEQKRGLHTRPLLEYKSEITEVSQFSSAAFLLQRPGGPCAGEMQPAFLGSSFST